MATINSSDSILASIKRLMPNTSIPQDYNVFDEELMAYINAVLATLQQLGVGELDTVFVITGYGEAWSDYIDDPELLSLIPVYVGYRVKMMFDAPKSSTTAEAYKGEISQFEFRIMDAARRYRRRKEGD